MAGLQPAAITTTRLLHFYWKHHGEWLAIPFFNFFGGYGSLFQLHSRHLCRSFHLAYIMIPRSRLIFLLQNTETHPFGNIMHWTGDWISKVFHDAESRMHSLLSPTAELPRWQIRLQYPFSAECGGMDRIWTYDAIFQACSLSRGVYSTSLPPFHLN